jgi:bacteriocin biosynthesis cyclodehydratase domain-containing protein
MILRLDPSRPFVWRTPSSAQFGIDHPIVVLPRVTLADERMLSALAIGVPRPGVSVIGLESGATESDVRRLLRAVDPVLQQDPPHHDGPPAGTLALAGTGPTARRIADTVAQCGLTVHRTEGEDGAERNPHPDIAVLVAHYVVDPGLRGYWLRDDVPHLPIVFGDAEVHIGPVIEPGIGPCLYCLERQRADADDAWPAIASQLLGKRSLTETPLMSAEVAALAARIVVSRFRQGASSESVSWHLDVASGTLSARRERPHPLCLCTGLARQLA